MEPKPKTRKPARNTPVPANQARDSTPLDNTKRVSTILIPVDPRHENALGRIPRLEEPDSPKTSPHRNQPPKRGESDYKLLRHKRPQTPSQHTGPHRQPCIPQESRGGQTPTRVSETQSSTLSRGFRNLDLTPAPQTSERPPTGEDPSPAMLAALSILSASSPV